MSTTSLSATATSLLNLHYAILGSQPTLAQLNGYAGDYNKEVAKGASKDAAMDMVASKILESDAAVDALKPNVSSPTALATSILGNVGITNSQIVVFVTKALDGSLLGFAFPLNQAVRVVSDYVATYKTGMAADATWDADLVAAQKVVAARPVPQAVGFFTLTNNLNPTTGGVDNYTGGSGADMISGIVDLTTAANTSYNAGDAIDGGAGTDALSLVLSSGAATLNAGAATVSYVNTNTVPSGVIKNVETLNITNATSLITSVTTAAALASTDTVQQVSDVNAGTITGLKSVNVISSNSATTATTTTTLGSGATSTAGSSVTTKVSNLVGIVDAAMKSGGGNLELAYGSTAVAGTADVQKLAVDGQSSATFTVNGIETLAVSSNGTKSGTITVQSATLKNITVDGAAQVGIKVGSVSTLVESLDASTATGKVSVTSLVPATVKTIKGGSADDTFGFTTAFASTNTVDGGAGSDTLSIAANLTGTWTKFTNFEKISTSTAGLSVDLDAVAGITAVSDSSASGMTITNASATNSNVTLTGDAPTSLTITSKASGGTLNLTLNNAPTSTPTQDGVDLGTLTANGYSTLNLTSSGSAALTAPTTNDNTISSVNVATITVTGDTALSLGLGSAVKSVDASASTGALVTTGGASAGVALTSGAGKDSLTGTSGADTIIGGDGNDMITGGAGADFLDGGLGFDTAVFSGSRTTYSFSRLQDSATLQIASDNGDIDTLSNIESLRFSDGTLETFQLVQALNPQLLTSRNRSGDHAILLKPSRQTESEATLLLFTDDNRPPQTSVIEVAPAELAASNWVLMPQEGDPKAFWLVKSTFIATNNNAGEVVFSAQGVGDATALSDATSSEFTARMEQLFSVRPENFPLDQEVIDIRIHDLQNDKVLITWTTQNLTSGKLSLYGAIARSPAVEQPVEDYASQLSNLDNDWFVITDQERPLAAEREVSVAPQIGGTFFVSWTAVGSSNRDTDVFGAFFSETGQRFSAPFELSSDSSASQSMPSARMLDTGHVSVIWIEKKFDITNIVQETLSLGQTDAVASPIMNIPSTRTVVDRPIALAYAGSSRVYWLEGFADPYFGGDLANLEYAWFSTARPANRQVVTNLSPDQIQFGYLERDWTDLVQMAMSEIAGQIDNQLFSDTSARPIVLVEQKTPSRYQASFSLPDQRGIVKTTAKGSGFSYNEKDIDQNDRDFVLNEYTASVYADSDDVEPLSEFFLSGNFEVKDGDFTQFSISKIGLNIGNGLRATVLGYLDLNQGKLSSDRFELKIELDDLSLEAGSLSDVSLSVLLSDYGFDLVNNQVLRGKIQQVGLVVDHNDRIDYLLGNGLDLGILVSKPGASLLENGGSLFDESNGILIRSDKDTWPGNGVVTGSAGRDALFGLAGNDTLISLGGNDTLDGGLGIDNAVLPGKQSEYLVDWDVARASLTLSRGAAEKIVLKDIEFINFSDTFYSLKDVLLANRVGAHAVYRFYDPGRELHIYTRLGSEFEQLFAAQTLSSTADVDTYRFEGVAFGSTEANDFAYYAVDSSSVNSAQQSVAQLPTFRAQAVFRLYNPRDNSHFLSVNNKEISQKTATGWTVDGVAFNAFPDRPGLVPIRTGGESSLEAIFAFQNAFTGDFVYLPQQEKLPLGSDSTWVSRGLAFWVPRDLGYDQQINGASAAETLSGEGGHDRIFGGKGDDQLNGGIGHDSLFGEGGSDRLKGYIGDDFLDGGEGIDTAVFNGPISAYAISFDPSNARFRFVSTEEGTDTVINVERFSFADGVFDAAQLPTQSRAGMIYHWKSHALLPGVTVAGLDPKSIQPDGADRFDLRAATLNPANNTLSVELWMNNRSQSVSNFGFTSQTTGASAASFVSALDNAAWNLNINTANPNRVVVAAFMKNAVDSVTGSVKLGTLQFTLAAGATAFLNFANVEIGKDRTPDAQLIMRPGSLSTGPDGRYAVSNLPFLDQELSVQRGVSDGSPKGGVTAADALAALMLAVELNPNLDPDGTGPMKAPRVSPYQVIAADVNQDGVVSSIDAFTILKMAVGLSEAPPPAWFFVPESRDFWDETQGQFTIDRLNASWDPRIIVPATQSQANLVGVIRGDVNGSWALESPNTVDATNPTHFQNLATLLAVPLDQWGIAPGG